jgi:hypothetical protein
MVSDLWLVPAIVLAVSLWPLLAATRLVAAELNDFRRAVGALAELRPALAVVQEDVARAQRALQNRPLR